MDVVKTKYTAMPCTHSYTHPDTCTRRSRRKERKTKETISTEIIIFKENSD